MTTALLFIAYLASCLLVGYIGRDRLAGFWGFCLLSFILTPLVMLIVLVIGTRRDSAS